MNFGEYGYIGVHTRDEAAGAIPNGTRIVKTVMEPGDGHPIGSLGTVLGSMATNADVARRFGSAHFYFVEWDAHPRVAVGVASAKIARA